MGRSASKSIQQQQRNTIAICYREITSVNEAN